MGVLSFVVPTYPLIEEHTLGTAPTQIYKALNSSPAIDCYCMGQTPQLGKMPYTRRACFI